MGLSCRDNFFLIFDMLHFWTDTRLGDYFAGGTFIMGRGYCYPRKSMSRSSMTVAAGRATDHTK